MARSPFTFRGIPFDHFDHVYNHTSANMRSVEVPIIRRYLVGTDRKAHILEIGNVLSHYQPTTWPVIDAREPGERVVNADVMKFRPDKGYNLVVSISTLEHVGQGRYAQFAESVPLKAITDHIRTFLAPGGVFVATIPIGYNEMVDSAIKADKTGADRVDYMRQANGANEWVECTKAEALASKPGHWASAMAVLQVGWFAWNVLNVGAGNKIIPYAVNHDLYKHRAEIAVAHDLNQIPWPWEDNSFDMILACAVFEHLQNNLVITLNECWRILRRGGRCHMKLPHWHSESAHDDPTHAWFYGLGCLDQFDPKTRRGRDYGFYTKRKWDIIQRPTLNRAKSSFAALVQVRK